MTFGTMYRQDSDGYLGQYWLRCISHVLKWVWRGLTRVVPLHWVKPGSESFRKSMGAEQTRKACLAAKARASSRRPRDSSPKLEGRSWEVLGTARLALVASSAQARPLAPAWLCQAPPLKLGGACCCHGLQLQGTPSVPAFMLLQGSFSRKSDASYDARLNYSIGVGAVLGPDPRWRPIWSRVCRAHNLLLGKTR